MSTFAHVIWLELLQLCQSVYQLGKFTMVSKPLRFLALKAAQDAHYCLYIYM